MGNKQGHELTPEEKQKLRDAKEREKRLLKEEKELKKQQKKDEKRLKKENKKKGIHGGASSIGDGSDAQSIGGSSVWSEKSVGADSQPESWYHSASEPGSKRSSIYMPASAGPGYYQHECWTRGYEESGSEKSSKTPSRSSSKVRVDTSNLRSSSLERYPLGVPTGQHVVPGGSIDLSSAEAKKFLTKQDPKVVNNDAEVVSSMIASRYEETIRSSREKLDRQSVDRKELVERATLLGKYRESQEKVDKTSISSITSKSTVGSSAYATADEGSIRSLKSSIISTYHSAEEGSVRSVKRKTSNEGTLNMSSIYDSAEEGSIVSHGAKRMTVSNKDTGSLKSSLYYSAEEGSIASSEVRRVIASNKDTASQRSSVYYSADEGSIISGTEGKRAGGDTSSVGGGSLYYSADEGGSLAGSLYYTATSGSEVEDHPDDDLLGKDRPSAPGRPEGVDREGSALSTRAYVRVENDALLLRWDPPQTDGGSPITGYIMEKCEGESNVWVRVNLIPIKNTEYAVANLIGGKDYRFRVSAENAVGCSDPSSASESVSISVDQEGTEPHFLRELRNVTAIQGQRVEFTVDIVGTPMPDVTWYKDGFELYDTKRYDFNVEGDRYTLALKTAKITDSGDIRVRATNRAGVANSQAVLNVNAPPQINLPPNYEQGIIFDTDELIRLRVPYTGRPQPTATWLHNHKEIVAGERHSQDVSEKFCTLKIAGASRVDKGMYTLNLENEIGKASSAFFVTVTDRPDPPSMPAITDVSGTSVSLRWENPADDGGCRISNYTIEYFRVGWDVWLKAASSHIPWTQLSDLIVGSEYKFRVKAENAYGVSDPGPESEQILIEEGTSPPGSFDYETYKSTTAVGSSLPADVSHLKGDSTSFESGEVGSGSDAEGYAERLRLREMGFSDELGSSGKEPSLDLGTSSSENLHRADVMDVDEGLRGDVGPTPPPRSPRPHSRDALSPDSLQRAHPISTPSPRPPGGTVTARMEAVTVAAGGEAVLVVALEGIDAKTIHWQKGGQPLEGGSHYTTTSTKESAQLLIHGASPEDTGTYTAVVTRQDGTQARAAVALRVATPGAKGRVEAPVFVRTLSDLATKVGTRVRFLVELRAASDVQVYWYHANQEILGGPRHRLLREGNFFCVDIAPLTVADEGTWRCVAENASGQATSSAMLRVMVPKGYRTPIFLEELEALLTEAGTVSLECKVVGVPTPLLKWYKDGKEIKAGDVFALTANPDDPTSLGTYTCEAINCMGVATSSSKVRVMSREGSLRPPSRTERSPTPVGPVPKLLEELTDKRVKIGEKLKLDIKVIVPPDILQIIWYNNGRKIEESEKYRLSDEGGGNYSLEVSPVELGDDGEWKVVIKNQGGYSSSSCKLTLTVPRNYRSPRFLEDLKALLTDEGLVSFECKVVGYPTPVLQWFKDGQELKPGDVYQLSGTNSLGKYSCIAKNVMGETMSSAELTLDDIKSHLNEEEKEQLLATNVPPRFMQGLKSRDTKIGEPIRLTVQVTVTPAPTIAWYHEDEVISESTKFVMGKEDPGIFHLDISKLDMADQGEWKCMASNDYGHSVTTANIKLVIPRHYKKPVFLEPLRAVLSQEGTVNLECKVIGVPQPTLKWFKDGVELKPGDIHRIISGEDGTCCLGTYTCEAFNCMGSDSSSAELLGFEDKVNAAGSKNVPESPMDIMRNPSLSTIQEEHTSQISIYESVAENMSMEEEHADISVSIDGREVSISLYETPDISEAEAKQIAEIYADEISDHLSAHESNHAELPPLRFSRQTSKKGPLLMEAMVIDVENEAFDEYMSMADVGFDDLRTEADVDELSAMEAVVVDEREPLRSDIADLPEMEVWGEEHVSAQIVSAKSQGVANINEANILEPDLRSLSEQGMSMLHTHAKEKDVSKDEALIINDAQVINGEIKSMTTDSIHKTVAQQGHIDSMNVAQMEEQIIMSAEEMLSSEKAGKQAQARRSVIAHEAVGITTFQEVEEATSIKSEEKSSKKVKKAKTSKKEQEALVMEQVEVVDGQLVQSMQVSKAQAQHALEGQVSAAGVAMQQEQDFYTAAQDIPESFVAEETEADFSEIHSTLEPMQYSEHYGYEHAQEFEGSTLEEQRAMEIEASYRQALGIDEKEGYIMAEDFTVSGGQETQAHVQQTLHEAVGGYEALMVQEADVDVANLNVFNREDMSHMLTQAQEKSGSLAECIVIEEADLQSEAAIVSQRPAAKPETAEVAIVEGVAESAVIGEKPVIEEMDVDMDEIQNTEPKKRSSGKTGSTDSLSLESKSKKSKTGSTDSLNLSGSENLTPEQIKAKKAELIKKMEEMRAKKEAIQNEIESPSTMSTIESTESKEANEMQKSNKLDMQKTAQDAVEMIDAMSAILTEQEKMNGEATKQDSSNKAENKEKIVELNELEAKKKELMAKKQEILAKQDAALKLLEQSEEPTSEITTSEMSITDYDSTLVDSVIETLGRDESIVSNIDVDVKSQLQDLEITMKEIEKSLQLGTEIQYGQLGDQSLEETAEELTIKGEKVIDKLDGVNKTKKSLKEKKEKRSKRSISKENDERSERSASKEKERSERSISKEKEKRRSISKEKEQTERGSSKEKSVRSSLILSGEDTKDAQIAMEVEMEAELAVEEMEAAMAKRGKRSTSRETGEELGEEFQKRRNRSVSKEKDERSKRSVSKEKESRPSIASSIYKAEDISLDIETEQEMIALEKELEAERLEFEAEKRLSGTDLDRTERSKRSSSKEKTSKKSKRGALTGDEAKIAMGIDPEEMTGKEYTSLEKSSKRTTRSSSREDESKPSIKREKKGSLKGDEAIDSQIESSITDDTENSSVSRRGSKEKRSSIKRNSSDDKIARKSSLKRSSSGLNILTPEVVRTLSPETVQDLTPENIKAMSLEAISVFPPNAVAALSPEAVAALTPEAVQAMSPEAIKAMTPECVKAISPKAIQVMSPEAIMVLSPEGIKSLTPEAVKALTPEAMKVMSLEQVKAITREAIKVMSPETANAMTPDKVKAMHDAIRDMSPEKARSMSPESARKMGPNEVRAMSPAIVKTMSVEAIQAIPSESISAMSPEAVAVLSPEVVKNLSPDAVQSMAPEAIQALSPEAVRAMSPEAVRSLSPEVVKMMTPEAIEALSPEAVRAMSPEAVRAMSPEAIMVMSPGAIRAMSPEAIRAMSPDAVNAMSPGALKAMSPEAISVISSETVGALSPEAVRAMSPDAVKAMSPEAIHAMSPESVQALKPEVIRAMSPEKIMAITPEAFKEMSVEAVKAISTDALKAMSPEAAQTIPNEVISQMSPEAIEIISPKAQTAQILTDIKTLSQPEAVKEMTPRDVRAKTPESFKALSPEAVKVMTPEMVAALTPEAIQSMTPAAVHAMTPQAATAISPEAISCMSPDAIKALSPDAIKAMSPQAIQAMTPEAVGAMSPDSIKAMSSEAVKSMSPEAISAITPNALKVMSPETIKVIPPEAIQVLSVDAVKSLTIEALKQMPVESVQAFSAEAVSALSKEAVKVIKPKVVCSELHGDAKSITPDVAQSMSPVEIKLLTPDIAKQMPPEAVSAIPPKAMEAMTPESVKALPPATIHELSPDAVQALSPEAVKVLSPEAVKAIVPEAIRAMSPEAVKALPPKSVKAMTPEAVSALSPESIHAMSPDAIKTLTPDAIKSMSPEALMALTPEAVKVMSPEAIKAIAPEAIGAMSPEAVKALPPKSVQAMTPEAVSVISPDSIHAMSPDAIKALSPDAIKSMSPEALKAISPEAVKVMSTEAIKSITPEAIGAMSPEAVKALPPKSVQAMTPEAVSAISPDSIHAMSPDAIKALTPDAIKSMSPEALKAISPEAVKVMSPEAIKAITPEAIGAMTPEAVKALPPKSVKAMTPEALKAISPESIHAMSPDAIKALTPDAIKSMSPEALKAISPEAVKVMSTEAIKAISPEAIKIMPAESIKLLSADALKSMSAEAVQAISSEALSAMSTKSVKIISSKVMETSVAGEGKEITPETAKTITPVEIRSMSPESIRAMSPEVIKSITPDTMRAMSPEAVKSLSPESVKELTPEVMKALTPEVVKVMTPEAIQSIAPEALNAMTPEAVRAMSPEVIKSLSPEAVQSISPTAVRAMSPEAIRALSPEVINTMSPESITALSPEAVRAMSPEAINAITPNSLQAMSPEAVRAISPEAAKALSVESVQSFSSDALHAMSVETAKAISSEVVSSLSPEAAKAISVKSEAYATHDEITITSETAKSITPMEIKTMSPAAVQELKPETLKLISPEAIKAMTPECVEALSPEAVKAMSPQMIKALSPEAIKAMTPEAIKVLSPEAVGCMSAEAVKSISSEAIKSLTPEAVKSLSPQAVKAMSPEAINAMTPEAVNSLSPDSVKALSPQAVKALSPEVVQAISPEAIKAMSPQAIKAMTPEAVNSLSPEAVKEISPVTLNQMSPEAVNAISPEAVKAMSPQAIKQMKPDAVNALSPEAVKEISPVILNQMSPEAVKAISPEAVKAMSVEAIQSLSSEALQSMSVEATKAIPADVISEMNNEVTDVITTKVSSKVSIDEEKNITPEKIESMSVNEIKSLRPGDISQMSPEAVSAIPPEAVKAMSSQAIKAMTPEAINSLSPEAVKEISPVVLNQMSPEAVQSISPEAVKAMSPQVIKQMKPEAVNALSPEAIKEISPVVLNQMSPEAVQAISPEAVKAMSPQAIKQMKPDVVHALSPEAVKEISPAILNQMSPEAVNAISPEAVKAMSPQAIKQMKPDAVNALSPEAIKEISPAILNQMSPEAVKAISPEAVKAMSPQAIKQMKPDVVNALSPEAVKEISPVTLNQMSPEAVKAISPEAVKAMSVEAIQSLSSEALQSMSVEATKAIPADVISDMSNETTKVIATKVESKTSLSVEKKITPEKINSMSPNEIKSLSPGVISQMSPEAIKAIPPEAVKVMSKEAIKALSPESVKAMSPEAIKAIPPEAVRAMSPEVVKAISPEAIRAMSPEAISCISNDTVKVLSAEAIRARSPEADKVLPTKAVKAMSPEDSEAVKKASAEMSKSSSESSFSIDSNMSVEQLDMAKRRKRSTSKDITEKRPSLKEKNNKEEQRREEEDMLRLQRKERESREREMKKAEEQEKKRREEQDLAEKRKRQREEEDRMLKEQAEKLQKQAEESAEKRKSLKEDQMRLLREEEEREAEEERQKRERQAKRKEEQEKQRMEEEERIKREDEERKQKRKQRQLEEEKALKEQQDKFLREKEKMSEERRRRKEEEDEKMRAIELEREEQSRREKEERRKQREKEREQEDLLYEEEERKRKERRRKRMEEERKALEEEEREESQRKRKIEEEKKRLAEELRKREEEKRKKEDELKQHGEEFLKKEEERRKKKTEERLRIEKEEREEELRRQRETDERKKEERRKKRAISYEREMEDADMRVRRSRSNTPAPDVRRRDPRKRPKFSTKLSDRQTTRGQRVRMTCNIITPYDEEPPEVEWFKAGLPVEDDERIKCTFQNGVAAIEILHVGRSDCGEYTCSARNRHGRVSTTMDLRIKGDDDQKPSPPSFSTSLRERYVSDEDKIVLSCHVAGHPEPKITWLKDADKLPASPRFQTSVSEEGICKLIITSPRAGDSGTYTCHAENRVYRDEISVNVRVQDLLEKDRKRDAAPDDSEAPRFVSELCDQYVEENGTLTLQVQVAGSPTPEVLWLLNGRTLHPSGRYRISAVGTTHTFTLFQVTQKDLGMYSCKISNRYGHNYSMCTVEIGTPKPKRGVTAVREEAPSFVERPESMVTVYKEEEIRMSCTVKGEPTPRVTWMKGMHDISNTYRATKTVKDNTHTIVIRRAEFMDSGTYTVELKNTQGTARAFCSIKVRDGQRSHSRSSSPSNLLLEKFPSGFRAPSEEPGGRYIRDVPDKVGTPMASDIGKTWVSLQWGKPEYTGGVPVAAYKIESWIMGEEARWQELGVSPICSFDAYNLKSDREYLFRVTPRNKYGWGEPVMTPRPIRTGRKIEHPNMPRSLPHQIRAMPGGSICLDAQVTGEPMPEVKWYKDGSAIDFNRYPRFSSFSSEGSMHEIFGYTNKVSLRIDDLRWDDEGKYELEVLNPGGRVSSYTRLLTTSDCSILQAQETINNNLMALSDQVENVSNMAPQFTMRLRDRRVQVGFPVRLTCQIVAIPKPNIRWFKDGILLDEDDCHVAWVEDGHFYTLEISSSIHDDAGVYYVEASNPFGSITCHARLVVDSGLRSYISPMFIRELEDQNAREGSTITLQTIIEAYPTVGVVWHRDGQRIRPSRKHSFSLDADGIATLNIRDCDFTDGGLYTCTSSNEMGRIESMCRVSVATDMDMSRKKMETSWNMEPMFVRKPRNIDAEEGDRVIIECEVAGNPKPSVTWLRDWLQPSLHSDGARFQEVGDGPVYRLEIPRCKIEDTGAYSILAKNDHGETRAVTSLQVYGKGLKGNLDPGTIRRGVMEHVPVVTRRLQDVRCCDGDSVTLEATVDAPKNSLVRWEKQGKILKLSDDVESEWDGSKVRLRIKEVYPEDEGEYSCIIFNDQGKAVTSATVIVEMADDKENDVTVQMEHRPDMSRRTTPSCSRSITPSRWSRSSSVAFQREGSAHSWAGAGSSWRESSVSISHWRPMSRGASPMLLAHRMTPEPSPKSRSRRSHGPKFYYIPHDRIVEEGESVTFQCAVKGTPTPKAIWDKDSITIQKGGRINIESKEDIRLIEIPKVTQQDAGLYRITIENEMGREQATARLDVIKSSGNKYSGYVRSWHSSPLTTPYFSRTLPSSSVLTGSRLTLSTDFRGSPAPRAKWYKNGELLPMCEEFQQTQNGKTASLLISEVESTHAGTYTCALVSDAGKAECSCEVTVETRKDTGDLPPLFLRGLEDVTSLDGDQVTLTVKLSGTLPLKVIWVRNDQEIKPSADFKYVEGENGEFSLVIRDIFPEDAGVYIAEAYNAHGEAHSYCRLQVHDPRLTAPSPPRIVGSLTGLEVEEGTAARFNVTVLGSPKPSLAWYIDGRKLANTPRIKVTVDEESGTSEETLHSLGILHALSTDSGVVSVVATNSVGSDTANTTLKVNRYNPDSDKTPSSNSRLSSSRPAGGKSLSAGKTSPTTSTSPVPRIHPKLKDLKEVEGITSLDSGIGSVTRDSVSGLSSSLSNVSELEFDKDTASKSDKTLSISETIKKQEELLGITKQPEQLTNSVKDIKEEKEEEEEEGAEILLGPIDMTAICGQSAKFTANFIGNPEPTVSWLKKDHEIEANSRFTIETEKGASTLSIKNVIPDDCDKYTIVVRNKHAAHASFASLTVASVPDPPVEKPNLSEVTAESVTLSWYGPTYDGGSCVTGYTVECRKIGQVPWNVLIKGVHSTSYIARALDKGSQYEFRIRAQNIHGVSEPSKPSQPVTIENKSAAQNANSEEEEDEEYTYPPFEVKKVDLEPGSIYDNGYDTFEEVGKGRFGVVYRCMNKETGQKRAAKIIKCIQADAKEKVKEEISIMNSLRHPKLLQLAAAYERRREIVMVMEYINGGELFERVIAEDFALTERDCILFVRQICEGVQYMHDNMILHLDLKPENILCVHKRSHQIKLIDFGLARRFNPNDPCRVLFGTPEFIAPEIINYDPISFSSDMWSIGVVCYVLLSGLSPFMGDNDAETFANITQAEFDFDDDAFDAISEDAKNFITSLLDKRKEKRLLASDCLKHKWLAQNEGSMNKVVLSTDKLKKFIIRRKWQKTGNAIRAMGRIMSLTNRRSSQPSSPTRLSPLPENRSPRSTSPTPITPPAITNTNNNKGFTRVCPVVKPSHSVISERSDSGISECSFIEDNNNQNINNNGAYINGCAQPITGGSIQQSGKVQHSRPSIDWQCSVDSALCDDDDIMGKSAYGSASRKLSREGLLHAKTAAANTLMNAHSRI